MDCNDLRALVQRYVDGELAPELCAEAEAHLRGCADCRDLAEQQQRWRQAVRGALSYHRAPEALQRSVAAMAARADRPAPRAHWRGWAMAASILLSIALSSGLTSYLLAPPPQQPVMQEVVASHVRSLMADHLTDVASSNEHTVKPWFHGKLDFAPPVEDLAAQGFPLIGGRLDYLDRQAVAALVYRHAQHPINLFVFPSPGPDTPVSSAVENGYNILHWRSGDMAFWAVSDLEARELANFAQLMRHPG